MSSYVESAYSIEHRRLQEIVNQCKKELEDALGKVKEKEQEREQNKSLFRSNMNRGEQSQRNRDCEKAAEKVIFKNGILEKCDFIEKRYMDVLDASVKRRLDEIRVFAGSGAISEALLKNMLGGCEAQLAKKAQHTYEISRKREEKYHIAELPDGGKVDAKKGVKLGKRRQENTEDTNTDKKEFEQKLELVKSIERYKNDEQVLLIEKEYRSQPDFAKGLYARRKITELNLLLQEEIRAKEAFHEDRKRRELLKKRYRVLIELTCGKDCHDTPEVARLDDMTDQSIENLCEKLQKILIEKRKKEYMSNAVKSIMQRHGIPCWTVNENDANLQRYQYDQNVDFDISGLSQKRFIVEMNGKFYGKTPTLDECRKSVRSAKRACSFLKTIREELEEEFGIVFDDMELVEPSEKSIVMRTAGDAGSEQSEFCYDGSRELIIKEY